MNLSPVYQNVTDASLVSEYFESYVDLVKSARGLMEDLATKLDQAGDKFSVVAETAEQFSGTKPISPDWSDSEMARIWICDIHDRELTLTCARARIFAVVKDTAPLH